VTPTRTVAIQRVEVGAIVRIAAAGSRETNGESRVIPAMVIHQWPDGSLQLYAFHFQGSPLLQQAVKPEMVEMVMSRNEFDMIFEDINRRITELENQIVALGGKKYNPPTKFVMTDDAR
jgi:hypothetical protein